MKRLLSVARRRSLSIGVASLAAASLVLPAPAHADFDANYCLGWWHTSNGWCGGGLGVHSYDYNRIRVTDAAAPLCQGLLTSAGNWRSGSACQPLSVWIYSHQYSGGSPYTYALCAQNSGGWRYIDCLASTP